MQLLALPAFSDNYLWLLHHDGNAIAVDPGDAQVVQNALAQLGLTLTHTLLTHHHPDHTGGVAGLRAAYPRMQVFGPANERIAGVDVPLIGGQVCTALGLDWQVIDVAGHTRGHVAYFYPGLELDTSDPAGKIHANPVPLVFCGDALFSAGCGRLFEGTAQQMHDSLARLSALPDATLVCSAHEYTLSNLRFAAHVEPRNAALQAYRAWAEQQRQQQLPTLPSSMGIERNINPFLRTGLGHLQQAATAAPGYADVAHIWAPAGPSVQAFAALRHWKNQF